MILILSKSKFEYTTVKIMEWLECIFQLKYWYPFQLKYTNDKKDFPISVQVR